MGFPRKRHAFRVSALSLAVPLSGCDTVFGLQELQRQKDGENFSRALQSGFLEDLGKPRQGRPYKGPYPSELTTSDLKKQPQYWKEFFWGQGWQSYNLAEDIHHLRERCSENVVYFLPNYLRLLLGIVLAFMMWRPWSFLGALVILSIIIVPTLLEASAEEREMNVWDRLLAAGRRRLEQLNNLATQTQVQQQAGQANGEQQPEMQTNWSYVACLCVAAYSNLLWVVLRALLQFIVLGCLHAAFKRSDSELSGAGVHAPGVALLEVLGLRRGRSEDPRRLPKQVCNLAVNVGLAGVVFAWHAAQAYCVNSLRYFRR